MGKEPSELTRVEEIQTPETSFLMGKPPFPICPSRFQVKIGGFQLRIGISKFEIAVPKYGVGVPEFGNVVPEYSPEGFKFGSSVIAFEIVAAHSGMVFPNMESSFPSSMTVFANMKS